MSFATMLAIIVFCFEYANNAMAETNSKNSSNNFAVVVKESGLWAVNLLNSETEVMLDEGGVYKKIRISPDGKNTAYIKNEVLYITPIDFAQKARRVTKVSDNVISYTWDNGSRLVYSAESGGLNGFDLESNKSSEYIKSENRYEGIQSDGNGRIYGQLNRYYMKNGGQYVEDKGVICYDIASSKEKIIIPSIPTGENGQDMGFMPEVAGISKDAAYVYIWCKVHSASTNTDGVQFGVYEVKNNKFIQYGPDKIFALAYSDNLAVNPTDGRLPVINNGGMRDMNINKTLVQLNIASGSVNNILPYSMIASNEPYGATAKGMVTMTPAFLPDGKKVLYAASNANKSMREWNKEPHNIYIEDIKTTKVKKITNREAFDFAPFYISEKGGIAFVRRNDSHKISLWRIKGIKETLVTSDIKLDEYSWFYGHYDLENSLDIYCSKNGDG